MPEQTSRRIAHDKMAEPHIAGHRIPVRTIHDRVEGRGLEPKTVAARLGLDVADVYHALAYYYDHPKEMKTVRDEHKQAYEELREKIDRPPGVDPTETE